MTEPEPVHNAVPLTSKHPDRVGNAYHAAAQVALRVARLAAVFAVYVAIAAVVAAPVAAERAVEGVGFDDRLGSLPVRVSLAHNGVTTLDTGFAGQIYWDRTGAAGFGAYLRATGPPEAGGTLSSYVNPTFVEANAQFLADPGDVARAYGHHLRDQFLADFVGYLLWGGLVGGILLTVVFRGHTPLPRTRRHCRVLLTAGGVVLALGVSGLVAAGLFRQWEQTTAVERAYPMPGIDQLSFCSPQTLEVARQVAAVHREEHRPHPLRRERLRIRRRRLPGRPTLPQHADALQPRRGERIVIAEADPQGSLVGTAVRARHVPAAAGVPRRGRDRGPHHLRRRHLQRHPRRGRVRRSRGSRPATTSRPSRSRETTTPTSPSSSSPTTT